MKYIKYGLYSFVRKPIFNLLIIIEIAAIFIIGNMSIAVYNFRSVLYQPYADIISKDGYIYTSSFHLPYDEKEKLIKMYNSLEGDIDITYGYYFQGFTFDEHFPRDLFSKNSPASRNFYAFDDKIYSKFNLPLKDGRWAYSQKNDKGQIEAVVAEISDTNLKVGDVIKFVTPVLSESGSDFTYEDFNEVVIVGIIANDQYVPQLLLSKRNEKSDVIGCYSIPEKTQAAVFLVNADSDVRFKNDANIGLSTAFITYNTPPDEDIRRANEIRLQSAGRANIIDMQTFQNNSLEYLMEQYIKLLPILLCVFIVVLTELICSVAINTHRQMRNYGIYFLCGCQWKGCLKISAAYAAIIMAGGTILGAVGFLLFSFSDYAKLFEQNIQLNNLYVSLAVVAVMFLLSLIIPFFMVRRTSPVETLREN